MLCGVTIQNGQMSRAEHLSPHFVGRSRNPNLALLNHGLVNPMN